jgi:flagellar biosynthesis anti-sigma factor FlgM
MNIDRPAHPAALPAVAPRPPSGGSSAPAPSPAGAAQGLRPWDAPAATVPGSVAQLRSTHADFDATRVAELRERISSGTYAVNLERVADGLLTHLSDLSPRT